MRRAERWIRPSVTTQLRRTHRARAAAKIFLPRPRARFPRANACPTRAGLPETTTRQPPRHFPNSPQRVLRPQRREYEREVNLSGISSEPDPKHLWSRGETHVYQDNSRLRRARLHRLSKSVANIATCPQNRDCREYDSRRQRPCSQKYAHRRRGFENRRDRSEGVAS